MIVPYSTRSVLRIGIEQQWALAGWKPWLVWFDDWACAFVIASSEGIVIAGWEGPQRHLCWRCLCGSMLHPLRTAA